MTATVSAEGWSDARVLGEQERLFHQVHEMGMIALTVLHLRGSLDLDRLRDGLAWLQRRHGLLGAHIEWRGFGFTRAMPFIHRRYWFVREGTTEIPVRVLDGDWQRILQQEMNERLPSGLNPRMRIALVRETAERHHLIMSCDHAIGDAQAALLGARDLLAYLADPGAMPEANDTRLPPALEFGHTPSSDPSYRYQPGTRLPVRDGPGTKQTLFEKRWLEPAAFDRLKAAARAERASIHGAVAAAILKAAGHYFGMEKLSCLTNAEFRKLMSPPLASDVYGCYVDVLRSTHTHDQPFWSLAREVAFKLVGNIARHERQASVLGLPDFQRYWHETIPTLTHRLCIDGIAVTTGGDSGLKRLYGDLELEDITICATMTGMGYGLYNVALEFQGGLQLTVVFGANRTDPAAAAAIADRAMATLRDLPDD